jgi:Uma2 family endonuclease
MEAMQVAERMTAEEYLALPVPEQGRPWMELVDGEVVVNETAPLHNYVHTDLVVALGNWAQAKPGRGRVMIPLDVRLDERNVFAPDILWYSEGRAPARHGQPPSPMPDLAIEIRSPSTWRYDVGAKKAAYERHGLPELWLVDTAAEAVLVFRRSRPGVLTFDVALELDREAVLESPLLVGFALAVGELFPAG